MAYNERLTAREQLTEMAQRRYDIELKRLSAIHDPLIAQHKVDIMARRWCGNESVLRVQNGAGLTGPEI